MWTFLSLNKMHNNKICAMQQEVPSKRDRQVLTRVHGCLDLDFADKSKSYLTDGTRFMKTNAS